MYMCGRAMRFSRCFELSAEDKWMEDVPKNVIIINPGNVADPAVM